MAYGSVNVLGGGSGASIKSKQSGITQFEKTEGRRNLTINKVDKNKCVVLTSPYTNTVASASNAQGLVSNDTNLVLQRSDSDYTVKIYWEVIEFENVKNLQIINTTSSKNQTQVTKSINTVDPKKCLIFENFKTGLTGVYSDNSAESKFYYTLSANQIVINMPSNYSSKNVNVFIVEFN